MRKIKAVEPITFVKNIKTIKLVTPAKKKKKKIVSIHIEFVSISIIVLVKSVCDSIPMELIFC